MITLNILGIGIGSLGGILLIKGGYIIGILFLGIGWLFVRWKEVINKDGEIKDD